MNRIKIVFPRRFSRYRQKIFSVIAQAFKTLKKNNVAVDVYLIEDAEMKRLNLRYKGKNRPTNVLSFEASSKFLRPDIKKPFKYIGEIYLAPSFIKTRGEDISHLAIHGLLHLLGYAHKKKNDRIKMERLEQKLLSLFKV